MNEELRTITALVQAILTEKPETRNSDNILYAEVIDYIGKTENINIGKMAIREVLLNRKNLGIPTIETVGRCRRKLQEKNPELRAVDEVIAGRTEREKTFRAYARE